MKLSEKLAIVATVCGCTGMGLITAYACDILGKPANTIAAGLVIVAAVIAVGLALTRAATE